MPIDRKEQQAELIRQLGQLLAPLQNVVNYPESHSTQAQARATAKFVEDVSVFKSNVNQYCRGEAGHNYAIEYGEVVQALKQLQRIQTHCRGRIDILSDELVKANKKVTVALLAVPTEVDSEVLEAHSPFQAYCKLKVFFETTLDTLIWADPYMGAGLFHRYLNDLPESVSVTLITKRRNQPEFQSFLDISRLYASERGPGKYRLIVESGNHDRWLQCDQQIYHLGGSAKDAGKSHFTITKLEPSQANFEKLQDLMNSGTELFGPSQTNHR